MTELAWLAVRVAELVVRVRKTARSLHCARVRSLRSRWQSGGGRRCGGGRD